MQCSEQLPCANDCSCRRAEQKVILSPSLASTTALAVNKSLKANIATLEFKEEFLPY